MKKIVSFLIALAFVVLPEAEAARRWIPKPVSSSPPALIAHADGGDTGGAGFSTSSSIDTTGANLIVISASWFIGTTANVTISDSKGNTWTGLAQSTGGGTWRNQLFYCVSPTVGSGHTFTATGAGTASVITVQAWSNMSTSSPFDQQSGGANTVTSSVATGSITPSQANTVVIVGYTTNSTVSFSSFSGGYTASDTETGNANHGGGGMGYLVLTSATAQNVTTTFSAGCTNASRIASFKY